MWRNWPAARRRAHTCAVYWLPATTTRRSRALSRYRPLNNRRESIKRENPKATAITKPQCLAPCRRHPFAPVRCTSRNERFSSRIFPVPIHTAIRKNTETFFFPEKIFVIIVIIIVETNKQYAIRKTFSIIIFQNLFDRFTPAIFSIFVRFSVTTTPSIGLTVQ